MVCIPLSASARLLKATEPTWIVLVVVGSAASDVGLLGRVTVFNTVASPKFPMWGSPVRLNKSRTSRAYCRYWGAIASQRLSASWRAQTSQTTRRVFAASSSLNPNSSFKVEYLYIDSPSVSKNATGPFCRSAQRVPLTWRSDARRRPVPRPARWRAFAILAYNLCELVLGAAA
jgi:hypothetical protein